MNYNHLTINERYCIFQFTQSRVSIKKIVKALKINVSTISREITNHNIQTEGSIYK
ncbi:helix-turn-helix domain-containing protein [Kandleria sp.]|uniref:helix-turn-helix domain-containing protein n=1 Tax=Kandleria sp. TaxID=2774291 RepID=UPI001B6A4824|nr:helix-turn-helix domain-containing protein [Kandleria sp.]